MKTNTPKRKIFADAVDLLTEDMEAKELEKNSGVSVLTVEKIKPFHNHPLEVIWLWTIVKPADTIS